MAIVLWSRHPERMQDLKKKLGDAFRDGRLRMGLTQEALADSVGVTVETISNSERGESLVTLPVFLSLAAALELDLTEFVGAVPNKRRKVAVKRLRTEGELRQLAEQLNDADLDLLVGIARLVRAKKLA
jgi:transcriptional regulator with XRE-family HTH domain